MENKKGIKKQDDLVEFLLGIVEDGSTDEELWKAITEAKYGRDDFVRLANILVMLDIMPKATLQRMWDNM